MGILMKKVTSGLMTAADKGNNLIAKASGLSSAQLQNIEERRHRFMNEKPETSPEGIKRLRDCHRMYFRFVSLPSGNER